MSDTEFLQWLHDRLKNVHGENPNVDYMIRLREIIQKRPTQLDEAYIRGMEMQRKMLRLQLGLATKEDRE